MKPQDPSRDYGYSVPQNDSVTIRVQPAPEPKPLSPSNRDLIKKAVSDLNKGSSGK